MKFIKYLLLVALILTIVVTVFPFKIHKSVKFESINSKIKEKKQDIETKKEILAWNKWHSKLANEILKRANVPQNEELGTINYISFNVDKDGNITNIKIEAEPEKFSQIAKSHYFPYIRELNGCQLLKYPDNSQRKVVNFSSRIEVGEKMQYSSPDDFKDEEVVKN